MRFKPQAIYSASFIDKEYFIANYMSWLNEERTPFWACRYAALMGISRLIKRNEWNILDPIDLNTYKDSNLFVDLKRDFILSTL